MASTEADKIMKAGANARAVGHDLIDNPYFKDERMPKATGETLDQWQARCDAWEAGWRLEDAVRTDG